MRSKKKVLVGLAVVALGAISSSPANAASPITVFKTGLTDPTGIDYQYGKVYVAETGTGKILSVNPDNGQTTTEATGFVGPADVARVGSDLVVITGGSEVPDTTSTGDSSVFVKKPGQAPTLLADLKAYELQHNVDGQQQFDSKTHEPLDSLSNPFSVIRDKRPGGYVLVADAGANAVYAINSSGKVSTFFLPPLVTTGDCAGAPNNDAQHVGCDPVPTNLSYGADGNLYVSTLSSLVPGEGRVYVLDSYTGAVKKTITGFNGPTQVVEDNQGSIYVSETVYGAPEGEGPPPSDFDPSNVGRIVKLDKNGTKTYADVTMPIGLALNTYDNSLYATSWSIAHEFFGADGAGKLVHVYQSAFHAAPPEA